MSQIDNFLGGQASPSSGGESQISAFLGKPKRTIAQSLGDSALALGSGVVQGAKMLTDVAGADNAASRGLGSAVDALGGMESDYRKAQKQERAAKIKTAEASGSTWEEVKAHVGAFADAPIDTTLNALGTSAPTLAAAALSGGGSLAAQAAARAAPVVIGAAQGAGNIKGQIHETVKAKHLEAGATEAQATAKADAAQAYSGDNLGSIALGAGLGALAGGTGAEAALRRMAGKTVAEGAAPGVMRSTLAGALKEAPMEAAQGGQERLASNVALQGEGFDVPTWQGVAGQAALEGVASAPMGGGFGAMEGVRANALRQEMERAKRTAESAASDAQAKTDAEAEANKPLMLGNSVPDRLYVFPDGTVGRTGEVESYLAGLPQEEQATARAKLMGQHFTEVNDPARQQERRWWESYRDGEPAALPDHVAEVQQAVRSGTQFSTQQTVDTVRNAMEDAWLAQNVGVTQQAPSAAAAAEATGARLQQAFGESSQEAELAAVDARVRTGRILAGLQNAMDDGGANTAQVLGRLNEALARINEAPLGQEETQRVVRMLGARAAFTGQTTPAPLPGTHARPVDQFADNAAMESLIHQRASQRMGIDPAAGPLSKAAAVAVDSAAAMAPTAPAMPAQGQAGNPQGQGAFSPAIAQTTPTTGEIDGAEAYQAQQAAAQPAQAGAAQATPAAGPQGPTPTQASPTPVDQRPPNWRTSMLGAVPVAKAMGIEHKGKRLAQVVAEIDARDVQSGAPAAAVQPRAPAQRQRTAGDHARSRSYEANPFMAFLGKHGVRLDTRAEFAPGLAEMRKAMVPGYGPVFRQRGKELDALAQAAVEEGFLPEADERALFDLVDRSVRQGQRVAPLFTADAAESQMRAILERQAQFEREAQEDLDAEIAAEQAQHDAVMAREIASISDAEYAQLDAAVPSLGEPSNISLEDAMRALGFTEQEIQDDLSTTKRPAAQEGGRTAAEAGSHVARAPSARDGAGQAAAGAGQEGLSRYTPGEVVDRQEAQAKADAEQAKAQRDAAQRERAEREQREIAARQEASAENFELGQDPMDALAGQKAMFSRSRAKASDFVPNADGGLDYGEITPEMGKAMRRQAGKIRLRDGDGSTGLRHIDHGLRLRQLQAAGFSTAADFVEDVARNFDAVHKGRGAALFLVKNTGKPNRTLVVQLEAGQDGDFYDVKTALVSRPDFMNGKEKLWERAQTNRVEDTPSAISGQSNSSVPSKAEDANGAIRNSRKASDEMAQTDAHTTRLDRIAQGIAAKWSNAPEVVVLSSMQDPKAPEAAREADAAQKSQGAEGEPEGFWYKGKVYLVASALSSPSDVARVVYHEALGHAGLRGKFGRALDTILDDVARLRRMDVARKAREYGLDMNNPAHVREAAEEVLAELAQTRPELGLVKRALLAIRSFLRQHVPGFKDMRLTDAEMISSYLLPARGFIERGVGRGTGEVAFSRKGANGRLLTSFEKMPGASVGGATQSLATLPGSTRSRAEKGAGTEGIVVDKREDANLRFSRGTDARIGGAIKSLSVQNLKQQAGFKAADYRGIGLQLLGRRQLVDVYGPMLPELRAYSDLMARMDADKNEAGAGADQLAQDWSKLTDEHQLAELMHDATLAQMDPAQDYASGDNRLKYGELRRRFEALSPAAREVYARARDTYTQHMSDVRTAIKERIERAEMSSERRAAMLKRMDDEFFGHTKGVYFPLARFGQYVVVVKDGEGKTASVSRAETMGEADALRTEMLAAFPQAKGFTVGKVLKAKDFVAERDSVGRGFMEQLYGVLDKQGMDAKQRAELEDALGQLYLSSLPDLSWAKHGIHRKGTAGFSQDARRAFAQNVFHGASYLAKLRYGDQLQDELAEMQKRVDAGSTNTDFDSVKAQQVVDEMVKRHDAAMNPKSNALSTALTSLGFMFHLGLSPASAMVNLSQTALVAYPIMGAKWGFGKSSAALLKASQEAVRGKNDITASLNQDEKAAYEEAVRSGVVDVTMAHDLAGIAQGEDRNVSHKLAPVMRAASWMFHHAEKFNRQITFVAAYRLARETGVDHKQAYQQAVQATYDGHFDYSANNRPRFMQGNVARVLLLFKQYSQNMVYTMARSAQQSLKGATPEARAEARKALGGLLTMHAMAAGALGLPMVTTLLSVASMLGGDDDEPWDAQVALQNLLADTFGQKPAEVLAHGLSRLTPWDISGRVGLDKLIFPDVQEGLEGQRLGESAMTAALGPVAAIGINALKGMQEMSEGRYARGLETMAPTVLRGPLKAWRYETEGVKDKTGIVVQDEVDAAGLLGQAAGFSPSGVRNAYEGKAAIVGHDRALQARRSALVEQFAMAAMAKDEKGKAEAREAIARFNDKNPNRRIQPLQLLQSVHQREKRIREAKEGVYLPTKRRDVLEQGRFATGV